MRKELPAYCKYPYLISLKEYLSHFYSISLSVNDLVDIPGYLKGSIDRLRKALMNEHYKPSMDEGREVITFHLALILASLSDPWALRKLADYESKRTFNYLLNENDSMIAAIARKLGVGLELLTSETNKCGYRVVIGEDPRSGMELVECYQFRVKIPTYLKLTSKLFTDPKWKLVNRLVRDGYVYLNKRDAARILEDAVKEYIANIKLDADEISNPKLGEAIQEIRRVIRDVRGFTSDEALKLREELKGEIREDLFPPCIKSIMDVLLKGEHLTHHQRFALATFLLNIGASVDYVLDLMKHTPDFNERIARYQVEHLAGLRGSRKKYSAYSCEKMKTLGMCVAECGTKTPLQYYWKQLKAARARGRKSSRSREE